MVAPRHRKLAPHIGRLTIGTQHLDFRHDLLLVQLARQIGLAIEQRQGFGNRVSEARNSSISFCFWFSLLRDDVDVLRHLAHMGIEYAAFGLDGARRGLD